MEDEEELLGSLKDRAEERQRIIREFDRALKAGFALSDTTYQTLGNDPIPNQRYLSNTSIVPGQQIFAEVAPGVNAGVAVPRVRPQPLEEPQPELFETIELFSVQRPDATEVYLRQRGKSELLLSYRKAVIEPYENIGEQQSPENTQIVGDTYLFTHQISPPQAFDTILGISGFPFPGLFEVPIMTLRSVITIDVDFQISTLVATAASQEFQNSIDQPGSNERIDTISFASTQSAYKMRAITQETSNAGTMTALFEFRFDRLIPAGFLSISSEGEIAVLINFPYKSYYGAPGSLTEITTYTEPLDPGPGFVYLRPEAHPELAYDWRGHLRDRNWLSGGSPPPVVPAKGPCEEKWGEDFFANIQGDKLTKLVTTEFPISELPYQDVPARIEIYSLDPAGGCTETLDTTRDIVIPRINPAGFGVPAEDIHVLSVVAIRSTP